jgi:Pyruvate/2-oxoacid:ferredoxin oxidoreductase delta subunit
VTILLKKQKNRWSEEELVSFKNRWRAVTIPVNIKINTQQTALHLDHVLRIIKSSEKIAIANCVCRTDLQNCDFPRKVCLSLDNNATKNVTDGRAEFVSKAEAEKIILKTHKEGLILLALHQTGEDEENIQAICSCCSCCCHALQGLLLMNMKGLVKPSKYISTHDPEKCINCGDCIHNCKFKARTLSEGDIMTFNPNYCFGCGLCVTNCSQNAIVMIERILT